MELPKDYVHVKGVTFPPNRNPSSFRSDVQTVLYTHDSDVAMRIDASESIGAETGPGPRRYDAATTKKLEKSARTMAPLASKPSFSRDVCYEGLEVTSRTHLKVRSCRICNRHGKTDYRKQNPLMSMTQTMRAAAVMTA